MSEKEFISTQKYFVDHLYEVMILRSVPALGNVTQHPVANVLLYLRKVFHSRNCMELHNIFRVKNFWNQGDHFNFPDIWEFSTVHNAIDEV